jgi:hypothetical protein
MTMGFFFPAVLSPGIFTIEIESMAVLHLPLFTYQMSLFVFKPSLRENLDCPTNNSFLFAHVSLLSR